MARAASTELGGRCVMGSNGSPRTLVLDATIVATAMTLAVVLSAEAHDWYTELTSPSGEACCTSRDCQPADHRYDSISGRLEVRVAGMWVPVDRSALLSVPSPDGRAHVCWWRHWTIHKTMKPEVRCVILPGEV